MVCQGGDRGGSWRGPGTVPSGAKGIGAGGLLQGNRRSARSPCVGRRTEHPRQGFSYASAPLCPRREERKVETACRWVIFFNGGAKENGLQLFPNILGVGGIRAPA